MNGSVGGFTARRPSLKLNTPATPLGAISAPGGFELFGWARKSGQLAAAPRSARTVQRRYRGLNQTHGRAGGTHDEASSVRTVFSVPDSFVCGLVDETHSDRRDVEVEAFADTLAETAFKAKS